MSANMEHIELQGRIINYTIGIEQLINDILISYFNPTNKTVFISHALNSSVMGYGAKIKVLKGIADATTTLNSLGLSGQLFDKLRRIGAIRNGFAHVNISNILNTDLDKDGNFADVMISEKIEVMSSSGKVDLKNPEEYSNEFFELYELAKYQLLETKKGLIRFMAEKAKESNELNKFLK